MESPETQRRTLETGWTGLAPPRTIERKRKGRNVDVISGLPTPPQSVRRGLPTPPSTKRARKERTEHGISTQMGLPTPQTLPRKRTISALSQDEEIPQEETEEEAPTPQWDNTFFSSLTVTSRSSAPLPRRRPGLTFAQQMGLLAPSRQGVGVGMGGNRLGHAFGHRSDELWVSGLAAPADVDSGLDAANPFFVPSAHPSSSPVIRRPLAEVNLPEPGSPEEEGPTTPLSKPLNFLASDLSPPRNSAIRDINKALDLSASKLANATARDAKRKRKEELRKMMDEDDNPFLQKLGESSAPRTKHATVDETKPFVTYVFRGAKKVFANPWLENAPANAVSAPEDEDYEPDPNPGPRLLWPKAPPRTLHDKLAEVADEAAGEGEGEDGEVTDEEDPVTPPQTARPKKFAELDPTEEYALRGTSRAFSSTNSIGDLGSPEPDPPVRRGLLFGAGTGHGRKISRG